MQQNFISAGKHWDALLFLWAELRKWLRGNNFEKYQAAGHPNRFSCCALRQVNTFWNTTKTIVKSV
jgi:hypothetical protein